MNWRWKVPFLALLAAMMIASFLAVFACGDDDDDDGLDEVDDDDDSEDDDDSWDDDDDTADDDDTSTDDDDDDSSTPDCTVNDLCTHLITECMFEYDMQTCKDSYLANCEDPEGYLGCSCDCLDDHPGTDETSCGEFWDCSSSSCWLAYCPEMPE